MKLGRVNEVLVSAEVIGMRRDDCCKIGNSELRYDVLGGMVHSADSGSTKVDVGGEV